MFRCIGNILLAASMFVIAGGHLAIIQSLGWATMIVEYSRETSVSEAVSKTFSGKAPCKFCKAVESGAKEQSKIPQSVKLDKKSESFPLCKIFKITAPDFLGFSYPRPHDEEFPSSALRPPSPVPLIVA